MEKVELIKETASLAAEHLPKTTNSVDNVVASIVNIFDVLLTPFQYLKLYKDYKMEKFKNNLIAKANRIPKEHIKEKVDLNIVGPTLEALRYTIFEDDLREMFENLLVSSIDKREDVFPSFVDIVRQLSSDEAKLLKYLSNKDDTFPLIDLNYLIGEQGSYYEQIVDFTDIGSGVLEKPELISAYLYDISRFGIIDIQNDCFIDDDSLYNKLENNNIIQQAKCKQQSLPGKYEIRKKRFIITAYGKSFINACVIEKKE